MTSLTKLEPLGSSPPRSEALYSNSLSVLEVDLDHLLQLGEGEATTCQWAPIFENSSDSNDDTIPSFGSYRGSRTTSAPPGSLVGWKGVKPSKPLDLSLPRSATELDELLFQEGRPVTVTPLDK
jgi:hypothetical protein